jgi:hypothetical protein
MNPATSRGSARMGMGAQVPLCDHVFGRNDGYG